MLPALHRNRIPVAWQIALLATVASLPVTVILNRLPDSGATPGAAVMVVGAFIAGVIAVSRSVDSSAIGIRTGFLGGIVTILTYIITTGITLTWSVSQIAFFYRR